LKIPIWDEKNFKWSIFFNRQSLSYYLDEVLWKNARYKITNTHICRFTFFACDYNNNRSEMRSHSCNLFVPYLHLHVTSRNFFAIFILIYISYTNSRQDIWSVAREWNFNSTVFLTHVLHIKIWIKIIMRFLFLNLWLHI